MRRGESPMLERDQWWAFVSLDARLEVSKVVSVLLVDDLRLFLSGG